MKRNVLARLAAARAAASTLPARSRATGAPDAGAVLRLPHRRRQQAGALGQDRRLHASRSSRSERPRPLPRARQVDERQSVHRARDQQPRDAEEPGSLQAAASGSSISRAARRPTPSATRSSAQGKVVVVITSTHPRDRDRRVADGRRAGAPARDRQFAAGEEDPRQRDLRAGAEPQSRRPDHGDRLVQQEPRHAVRDQPDPVPLSPVRRPRQQPRHVHVHAEGEPAHGEAAVARLVSRRCGSTSTRWAATPRASS